jgi:predicted nucleotidyltransferase
MGFSMSTKHLMPDDSVLSQNPGLRDWSILLTYRGSIAHGMYVPSTDPNSIDDIDLLAICVPDPNYYLGLSEYGSRGTVEIKSGPWDIVIYEARKMVSLLAAANPNVVSLLWLNPEHYLSLTPAGEMVIANRNLFMTQRLYESFSGYAQSQFHKMTHQSFQGYMGDRRKRLVEQFGYDTKNAAHCIRLLRMGIEALNTGEMVVERLDDAEELLDIKRGRWSLEKVKDHAEALFAEAEKAHQRSSLPPEPDYARIDRLCHNVVLQAWTDRGWTPRLLPDT